MTLFAQTESPTLNWGRLWEAWDQPLIAGNTLGDIIILFLFLLGGFLLGKVVQLLFYAAHKRFEKKGQPLRSTFARALGNGLVWIPVILAFFLATGEEAFVDLAAADNFLETTARILMTLALGYLALQLVAVPKLWLEGKSARTENKLDDMLVPIVSKSLQVTVILLVIVQIAQILSGQELSAIIAGLGIGGLAVALAAQDTLKNFFGTLTLLADKPFQLGERVNIDGHDGPVEEVGMRSTRIRTLDGHLVSIPNGELANKAIWNIGKRPHIRRLFSITVTYDTPPVKMREAKQILEDILKDHEGMHADFPPRVYFNDFNDASLGFMLIYWYHPADYWAFMAFSERVNMAILERFNDAGIEFAFPTQTLYLAGDSNRPLDIGVNMHKAEG